MNISDLHQLFLDATFISTDTRKIEQDSIFFALKGDHFDANTFAKDALEKGASFVVIDNPKYKIDYRTIVVKDVLETLQELALYHRQYLGLPIIALTGSNGKTTTKELINVVLQQKYNTKCTVGNFNNHIGVPLTLLSFNDETEIGIVEMGANHQQEIEFLCSIAEPDFGYITNFGKAHLEGFGGVEGVIKGKSELYSYLREHSSKAVVNLDDNIQVEKSIGIPSYTFSTKDSAADVFIDQVVANPFVQIKVGETTIKSNLIGNYNVSNICAAVAIGRQFRISNSEIKNAIENYIPENNRSQLITRNSHSIILDAYNANPSSMTAAINHFLGLDLNNKVLILGDMFELGEESLVEHSTIVKLFENSIEINLHFVGHDFYSNKEDLPNHHFYRSYEDFADRFKINPESNILIKGSRGMALERALELL